MNRTFNSLLLTILTLTLVGCAGQPVVSLAEGTRGEGNIPVGRIVEPTTQRSRLKITDLNGAVTETVSNEGGVFMVPTVPLGQAVFEIFPDDPLLPSQSFNVTVGFDQSSLFLADPMKIPPGTVVESVSIEILGKSAIRVGQNLPVKVTVNGKNVAQLRPLIWIDGGVARITPGKNLFTTMSGPGAINALVAGVPARLEFFVEPAP